ncbi:MAG: hypothetical protein IJ481_01005 [Alphaproteobacteria bacterium]|nr:hypothetical protein [Alphaproteobacteria bacterium]
MSTQLLSDYSKLQYLHNYNLSYSQVEATLMLLQKFSMDQLFDTLICGQLPNELLAVGNN